MHALFVLLALVGLSFAAPAQQLTLMNAADSSFFNCPSFTVRCVKDNKWPSGIVGNIGPKKFVSVGIRCNQAHEKQNTVECNLAFPAECEGNCFAYGPIPF